jgi:hypothetical protein
LAPPAIAAVEVRRTGVQNPESVFGVGNDALYADEAVFRMRRVWLVDHRVGIGAALAILELADGETDVGASVRVVDEDASA